jgi:hypothetical protein
MSKREIQVGSQWRRKSDGEVVTVGQTCEYGTPAAPAFWINGGRWIWACSLWQNFEPIEPATPPQPVQPEVGRFTAEDVGREFEVVNANDEKFWHVFDVGTRVRLMVILPPGEEARAEFTGMGNNGFVIRQTLHPRHVRRLHAPSSTPEAGRVARKHEVSIDRVHWAEYAEGDDVGVFRFKRIDGGIPKCLRHGDRIDGSCAACVELATAPTPAKPAKPRGPLTYAQLMQAERERDGVPPLRTCPDHGTVMTSDLKCSTCYAYDDSCDAMTMRASGHTTEPVTPPPWVPSCDPFSDIPNVGEYGDRLP